MSKRIPIYIPAISSHVPILNERLRNIFFKTSLQHCAKDKIVLDVGAGSGLLSAYALNAGAKFVYAIERRPAAAIIADRILSRCFNRSRFKVILGEFLSPDTIKQIDQGIDILVSETLGPGLFDEGLVSIWDTANPILNPGAKLIPDRLHADVHVWNNVNTPLLEHRFKNLELSNLLDNNFADALAEVNNEIKPFAGFSYTELKTLGAADIIVNDLIDVNPLTKFDFDIQPAIHPTLLHPIIKFKMKIDKPSLVGFYNKISFENQTLEFCNCSTDWKLGPVVRISELGEYNFQFNHQVQLHPAVWFANKLE